MALIKTTAIVDSISGKLNGTVFSKNRGGAYMRSKGVTKFKAGSDLSDRVNFPQPGNPQAQAQAILVGLSRDWSGIGADNINAWNAATSMFAGTNVFGDRKVPSGFNLYTGINSTILSLASKRIDQTQAIPQLVLPPNKVSLPVVSTFQANVSVNASTSAGTIVLAIASSDATLASLTDNTAILVEATAPMSAGISKPNASAFRQILVDNSSIIGSGKFAVDLEFPLVATAYSDVFGSFAGSVGKVIHFRVSFVNVRQGVKGIPQQYSEKIA